MEPRMVKRQPSFYKECQKCHEKYLQDNFVDVKGVFYADNKSPICNECIKEILNDADWEWTAANKLCQILDLPFIPKEFERIRSECGEEAFPQYAKLFNELAFEGLGWKDYNDYYLELKNKQLLSKELPLLNDNYYDDLRLRWGSCYDEEQLDYLENLYNGLLNAQNISGALGIDQAQKLCKISLNMDEKIRAGQDVDKMMASYDKLVKIGEFSAKNTKSSSDFDTFGEVVAWLEKRKWLNTWYDGANRDIVDEVIHSNQTFVQRLYTNESGLGEEVNERIAMLKSAAELEKESKQLDSYRSSTDEPDNVFEFSETNAEEYENEGYEQFIYDDVFDSEAGEV